MIASEVAAELNRLGREDPCEVLDAADVLRAVARGTRARGLPVIVVDDLEEIAAELGGPPWPT